MGKHVPQRSDVLALLDLLSRDDDVLTAEQRLRLDRWVLSFLNPPHRPRKYTIRDSILYAEVERRKTGMRPAEAIRATIDHIEDLREKYPKLAAIFGEGTLDEPTVSAACNRWKKSTPKYGHFTLFLDDEDLPARD